MKRSTLAILLLVAPAAFAATLIVDRLFIGDNEVVVLDGRTFIVGSQVLEAGNGVDFDDTGSNVVARGTIDARDLSADGAALDRIQAELSDILGARIHRPGVAPAVNLPLVDWDARRLYYDNTPVRVTSLAWGEGSLFNGSGVRTVDWVDGRLLGAWTNDGPGPAGLTMGPYTVKGQ